MKKEVIIHSTVKHAKQGLNTNVEMLIKVSAINKEEYKRKLPTTQEFQDMRDSI